MTPCDREVSQLATLVRNVQRIQYVQAPTSVLPRDAGEDAGGGWNDWNSLNEWNLLISHRLIASLWTARLSITRRGESFRLDTRRQ